MVKSQTTSITPATHAGRHVVGGVDPLIDPITTTAHYATHQPGGSDAIPLLFTPDTEVFSGTSPTSMTDLNISAVTGARTCLVGLIVESNNTVGASGATFKAKGSPYNIVGSTDVYGLSSSHVPATVGHANSCISLTDTNGIMQWYMSGARAVKVYVSWYIPLA